MTLRYVLSKLHNTNIKSIPNENDKYSFLTQIKIFGDLRRSYFYSDLKKSNYYDSKHRYLKDILLHKYPLTEYLADGIIELFEDYDYNPYQKSLTSTAIHRLIQIQSQHQKIKEYYKKIYFYSDTADISDIVPNFYCFLCKFKFLRRISFENNSLNYRESITRIRNQQMQPSRRGNMRINRYYRLFMPTVPYAI